MTEKTSKELLSVENPLLAILEKVHSNYGNWRVYWDRYIRHQNAYGGPVYMWRNQRTFRYKKEAEEFIEEEGFHVIKK